MTPVVEGVECAELKYSVIIEAVTQHCVVRRTSTGRWVWSVSWRRKIALHLGTRTLTQKFHYAIQLANQHAIWFASWSATC